MNPQEQYEKERDLEHQRLYDSFGNSDEIAIKLADWAYARAQKEIENAEARGFQRAIELLRKAEDDYGPAAAWADWLENNLSMSGKEIKK